ncbi:hypothetical protein [uncultured Sphingomonas sp.]|uniref:hypothetical protein n=1 Tax=uncultured Sphingomonas sp. TaxID=158754 RepID=UPI0025E53230|nr:hypothetical protein [uncultured Sphingomonas sp.]
MMAAALYSTLSKEWGRSSPEPPKPLSVDMVEAEPTGKARPTSGMRIGRDGFGTILSAPARHVTVPEKPPAAEAAMQTAEPPVPSQVAGLVRIVARLTPEPPAKEPTLTLEMPPRHFATILLRHGCLKLTEPGKPGEAHVVLPPLSKLYVGDDGFLVIGTPASGDENPRVGEPAWWEGDSRRPLEAGAVADSRQVRVRPCQAGRARLQRCGKPSGGRWSRRAQNREHLRAAVGIRACGRSRLPHAARSEWRERDGLIKEDRKPVRKHTALACG